MRLSEHERRAIVAAIQRLDQAAEIWLIGSRADDLATGGDIDLLVVSEHIDFSAKIDLLVDIKLTLGDQKIDLTVVTPAAKATDPFVQAVLAKLALKI